MQFDDRVAAQGAPNHPLAERMGVIAAFSHNIVVGSIFGTFSVMLASVEQRLGVSPQAAAVGVPLVVVGSALMASVAGVLMARYSLRRLLAIGAAMTLAAFLLLAFTRSYAVYLFAYGALLGPAMALTGSVGPATLVTRWFTHNRGLVLGLVHLPIVVAVLPIVTNWVLAYYGARAAYLLPAVLTGVILLPLTLLARDNPPARIAGSAAALAESLQARSLTVRELLVTPAFWAFAISGSAVATGAVLLGTVLVPMAVSWGFGRGQAAFLASIMSLVGIAGSVIFGWLADRIGGARGLALLCVNLAILWALLLLRPSFGVVVLVIALLGMHGAGLVPNLSRGLADAFGAASFSRGFGLATTLSLPLTIVAVLGSANVYSMTGSYAAPIAAMIVLYLIAAPITLMAARRRVSAAEPADPSRA